MTEAAQQTAKETQKPKSFDSQGLRRPEQDPLPLAPHTVQRREPGPNDVQIEILYCGVCHSDLHQVRDEWNQFMPTAYPCVPGHEIIGRVVKAGNAVKKFKEGDIAGVGCMVDSDRTCPNCRAGEEMFCESMATFTYNSPDKILGGVTYGGYTDNIVVDEAFVLNIKEKKNLAGVAPLLCAGITTYSPSAPLESWQRPKSGNRRPRRPRSHGPEIRESLRRECRSVHHLRRQNRRRQAPRRRRSRHLQKRRRGRKSTPAVLISSSTPFPPITI